MQQFLASFTNHDNSWYKAERISRAKLQARYPTAKRFRVTDGNIAAIDFGTTYCSLAFATLANASSAALEEADISTMKLNEYYERVPTSILLKASISEAVAHNTQEDNSDDTTPSVTCPYEVYSFGYDAMKHHNNLNAVERSEYLYFERFKMSLQHDESVHRNMMIKSSSGRDFYLVEVIAFVLKYLKNQLEFNLEHCLSPLKGSDFDWVITVPAIWRTRSKRMMREAAYMAGLTSTDPGISCFSVVGKGIPRPLEINPDHLTLALEPEAAAIHCQTMKKEHLALHCDVSGALQSSRYAVIDIGGGTVDVTVHRQDNNGLGVKVMIPPVGNDCGGTMVNKEFGKFMERIVDDKGFERFLQSSSLSEHTKRVSILNQLLYQEFENQKVGFGEESEEDIDFAIKLPLLFTEFYSLEKIGAAIDALEDDGVELEDDTVFISAQKITDFFQPAIDGILKCIASVLEKLQDDVDTIYLVGGFGGCKYTYDKVLLLIQSNFPDKNIRVIVPKENRLAVAQGAVKYRLKPNIVKSRAMDASYGTDFAPEYNPHIHDSRYVGMDHTGTVRVKDVYMKYVEKGEQISSNEVVTEIFNPLNNSSTSAKVTLYSSLEKGTKYVNDPEGKPLPSVRKIGEIHLDIPNPNNLTREERGIELTMDFSHTEIQIHARYLVTGEEVKVVADFLTSHEIV